MLISYPRTNAERMSLCDRAASFLAAGENAAHEGGLSENMGGGGKVMRTRTSEGYASAGQPDLGHVCTCVTDVCQMNL